MDQVPHSQSRYYYEGSDVIAVPTRWTRDFTWGFAWKRTHLDLESMSEVAMINYAHYGAANTVCYDDTHPHLLYTGGADGHVKVYDRRALGEFDDQPVGVFAGHENLITYIDARGDGRYLISNSMDNSIKLWDLRRFCGCETMQETVECVRQQPWEYSWQSILCAKKSTLKKDTSVLTFRGHTVDHRSVRAKFSPRRTGRRYIYTGSERGQVVVYDILASSPSEVAVFDPGLDPVHCRLYNYMRALRDVDWNPTTNEIVTVEWNGVTLIWKWDKFYINFRPGVENRSDAKNIREESCEPVVKR
ncbi:hypothetical protein KIN20_002408 [Parelaphostrongylus tenuis]|uniref:Uncharacterized protein n=1 Tax=Parelaphostrongylus tenuis TaxID=148309 RepID=A0AAD5ME61_PARTN|nr:hypothetical protein KIN20_002408 [Parelaphostrongylus tenuis]